MIENFSQGAKMKILGKKLPVEYSLIDRFYKSDTSYTRGKEVIGGRKTKEFFDNFCQIIFRKNLEMYERSGYFHLHILRKIPTLQSRQLLMKWNAHILVSGDWIAREGKVKRVIDDVVLLIFCVKKMVMSFGLKPRQLV